MDFYRFKLALAAWTWREGKVCPFHTKPRRKDQTFGRNDKRAARQLERRDREGA